MLVINAFCHSEPFACCHSERSEESFFHTQGKLREESINNQYFVKYYRTIAVNIVK